MYDLFLSNTIQEEDDRYFLRLFSEYEEDGKEIQYFYQGKDDEVLVKLREKLELDNTVKDGSLKEILSLCSLISNLLSKGSRSYSKEELKVPWNSLNILKLVEENEMKCDCGTYAIVLTETLLSLGYKAKWVQCLPLDLRYSDSHCVTHVFCEEYHKWMIADAALGLIYLNQKGIPLSLPEFRLALTGNERIILPAKYMSMQRKLWLLQYWRKNILRFHTYSKSCFGFYSAAGEVVHYYLDPVNYRLTDKLITTDSGTVRHIHTHNDREFWK